MRTFAPKPDAAQQTAADESTTRGRPHTVQGGGLHPIFHLQRTIGNQAVRRMFEASARGVGEDSATSWEPAGGEAGLQQFYQSVCPAAAPAGGTPLSGPVTAFGHSFNIITANAGVTDRYRAPTTPRPGVITQQGPSFSMGGRVEAPASAVNFRLGIIQQIIHSVRRAHYVSLATGAPLMICEYTRNAGLDILPNSAPPWYSPRHPREMTPGAYVSIADDPGGDFELIVNNQGVMQPRFEGKLARLSGCDQYRAWLVIQSPAGGMQAGAWVEWAVNWDFEYNTVFSPASGAAPTTTATRHGVTGWLTSAPRIGAGPPIPTSVPPATARTCIPSGTGPAAPPRTPGPAPPAASGR